MRWTTDRSDANNYTPAAADDVGAAAARGSACDASFANTYAGAHTYTYTYTYADTRTDAGAGATSEDDPPRQRDVIALVSRRGFYPA